MIINLINPKFRIFKVTYNYYIVVEKTVWFFDTSNPFRSSHLLKDILSIEYATEQIYKNLPPDIKRKYDDFVQNYQRIKNDCES